jgi:hypothetical protein
VGGGAGAAIGQEVGGRNGAVVGAGLGGAAGATIGRDATGGNDKPRTHAASSAPRGASSAYVAVEGDCVGKRKHNKGKGWAKGHDKHC